MSYHGVTMTTPEDIGKRMVRARKLAGVSQEELAVRLGVRVRTVQRWESGSNEPQVSSIAAYAEQVGVTLAWLVGAEDGDDPKITPDALAALREQWLRNGYTLDRIERLLGGDAESEAQ